jgi:hypothetical protein
MVKDEIVSWFIRNLLLPKMEVIDKPGFIITSSGNIQLREILIPETLIIKLEQDIVKTFGEEGKQALYSAGKKFGYAYASIANFPTVQNTSAEKFKEFAYFLVRWVGTTYSRDIKQNIDIKSKIFELEMHDYIVCSKNGLGNIMSEGGVSGIWAYVICDRTVEGAQISCEGRGDECCRLISAPPEFLKAKGAKHYTEQNLISTKCSYEYKERNQIRDTNYCKDSLRTLINVGMFKYEHAMVEFKGERHFLIEASLVYILENELKKLPNGEHILFQTAFDYGKSLGKRIKQEHSVRFMMDYLSVTGWGDILVIKNKVLSIYHPWLELSRTSNYTFFRGLASGLLSGLQDRDIILNRAVADTSRGYLNIIAEE